MFRGTPVKRSFKQNFQKPISFTINQQSHMSFQASFEQQRLCDSAVPGLPWRLLCKAIHSTSFRNTNLFTDFKMAIIVTEICLRAFADCLLSMRTIDSYPLPTNAIWQSASKFHSPSALLSRFQAKHSQLRLNFQLNLTSPTEHFLSWDKRQCLRERVEWKQFAALSRLPILSFPFLSFLGKFLTQCGDRKCWKC